MESNIPNNIPQHVAIIMDGNGRWARARMMPRVEGHRQGAKALKRIVKASRELGIRYLTVYAFSTENWKRPETEVSSLMKLFISALNDETPELKKNNVRLRAMGALDMLPKDVQEKLYEAMDMTKDCDALDLIIAPINNIKTIIDIVIITTPFLFWHIDKFISCPPHISKYNPHFFNIY